MQDTCDEVLGVIQAYADGEVDVEVALVVAAHLERCLPCARELGVHVALKQVLRRQCGADPDALARLRSFVALLTYARER